jgi:hypothetical protein
MDVLGLALVVIGVFGELAVHFSKTPFNPTNCDHHESRKKHWEGIFTALVVIGVGLELSAWPEHVREILSLKNENLKLESKLAWRNIPPKTASDIIDKLKQKQKGSVIVQSDFPDVEAKTFAGQISSILKIAGYDIKAPTIPLAAFGWAPGISTNGLWDGTLMTNWNGVFFLCEDTNNVPLHSRFIQDAFGDNGLFIPALQADSETSKYIAQIKTTGNDGTTIIWVSRKPF